MDEYRDESFLDIEMLHDNADELDAEATCPCGCGMPVVIRVAIAF